MTELEAGGLTMYAPNHSPDNITYSGVGGTVQATYIKQHSFSLGKEREEGIGGFVQWACDASVPDFSARLFLSNYLGESLRMLRLLTHPNRNQLDTIKSWRFFI